jgi:protein-tyrosine phosphatase
MDPVRVLFVCTANICRSPAAEHLARLRSGESDRFAFASAGFLRSGIPCPDRLLAQLARRGVDASGHRSRVVDAETVAAADLVVTMEVAHLRELVGLHDWALGRIVPFRELDRMLDRPRPVADVLEELGRREPARYLGAGTRDDVVDPYGGSIRAYRSAVDAIDGLVGRLVAHLHR